MINRNILNETHSLSEQFRTGTPYPHICIDNFFETEVAERILADFPRFDFTPKKNEFGDDGPKAVYENLSEISPFYKKLSDYLNSKEFNDAMSSLTGIEGLHWGGESMYGGGTHENINGAELDPHVDFNYDDRTKEHRRINLLVYLNKEWEQGWGGEFELHSDPRKTENEIKSFLPLFNRAVIMETSEKSWHGFPRIVLPADKEDISRKSLALYFYTKERPEEEIEGGHATFYIHRPLPESFHPGEVISQRLYDEVKGLVFKRDSFIELYQRGEIEASKHIATLEANHNQVLSGLKVPLLGWAKQIGSVKGYHHDEWIGKEFSGNFLTQRSINSVGVRFYVPDHAILPMEITFTVNNVKTTKQIEVPGMEEIITPIEIPDQANISVHLKASTDVSGVDIGANEDSRKLSVVLNSLIFE